MLIVLNTIQWETYSHWSGNGVTNY